MEVGIAGTGRMGTVLAARLVSLGHRVTVWNRTPERARAAVEAGAVRADRASDLARACEAVISIVSDEAALDAVYGGSDGLAAGAAAGKLFIDMSTVRPQVQRRISALVQATGAGYVECPVGGSVVPARDGKLLGFAGGAAADVERARPLLAQLCRRVERLGPIGAGASMKLAINLPLMVYWQALSEALSLVEHLGIDPARVVDLLSESSGGPNMLKTRGPAIAQALASRQAGAVSVDVGTMRKDLRTMLAEAADLGRDLPVTRMSLTCFDRAADAGKDAADCTQLPVWWLDKGGAAPR